MISPTNHDIRPVGIEMKWLGNGCWVFQFHEAVGLAVLLYAGSSSSIVTSSVFFFCSASGPAGRMLVTVWRRASICSSVSRSSLSSTICRRKPLRVTEEPHRRSPPLPSVRWPLACRARGPAPEPPQVSGSSPSWLQGREKPAPIPTRLLKMGQGKKQVAG